MNATLPTDLYPIPEAAQLAGLAPSTIYRRHRRGQLALWGWSRCWRVSLAELLPRDMRAAPLKPVQAPRRKADRIPQPPPGDRRRAAPRQEDIG